MFLNPPPVEDEQKVAGLSGLHRFNWRADAAEGSRCCFNDEGIFRPVLCFISPHLHSLFILSFSARETYQWVKRCAAVNATPPNERENKDWEREGWVVGPHYKKSLGMKPNSYHKWKVINMRSDFDHFRPFIITWFLLRSNALGSPAHREISLVQNHPPCTLNIKCFLIGCDCDSGCWSGCCCDFYCKATLSCGK